MIDFNILLDGEPMRLADFLDANDLDPSDVAALRSLRPGEAFELDLGAGGFYEIRRVDERRWFTLPAPKRTSKGAVYVYDGRPDYYVTHCGHPTARYPYMVFTPSGPVSVRSPIEGAPDQDAKFALLRDAKAVLEAEFDRIGPVAERDVAFLSPAHPAASSMQLALL